MKFKVSLGFYEILVETCLWHSLYLATCAVVDRMTNLKVLWKKSDHHLILIQEGVKRFLGWPGKTVNISMMTGQVEIRTICFSNRIVEDNSGTDCWVPPLWWRCWRPVSNFSCICFARLSSYIHQISDTYEAFPQSQHSYTWIAGRSAEKCCLKWRCLSDCITRCLLAEQLNT